MFTQNPACSVDEVDTVLPTPNKVKKMPNITYSQLPSQTKHLVLPKNGERLPGSQHYPWLSALPLALSTTPGSQPYPWLSALPLALSATPGSQHYPWLSALPLTLSATPGSQRYPWLSTLPLLSDFHFHLHKREVRYALCLQRYGWAKLNGGRFPII